MNKCIFEKNTSFPLKQNILLPINIFFLAALSKSVYYSEINFKQNYCNNIKYYISIYKFSSFAYLLKVKNTCAQFNKFIRNATRSRSIKSHSGRQRRFTYCLSWRINGYTSTAHRGAHARYITPLSTRE